MPRSLLSSLLLSALLICHIHAFLLPTITRNMEQSTAFCTSLASVDVSSPPSMSSTSTSPASIPSEAEWAKIFGRLADKAIFMDESAGQCCHSGCDNCEWRYDFDIMRAARPKWLVTYAERKFDSDAHTAKWTALFDPPASSPTSSTPMSDEDMFNMETAGPTSLASSTVLAERLSALPFLAPLGPTVTVTADEPLESETAAWLWDKLLPPGSKSAGLTARLMERRLKEWANGKDSLMWGDFLAEMRR